MDQQNSQPTETQEMPQEQEKKSYWKIWLAIFIFLIIAIALGFYFLSP